MLCSDTSSFNLEWETETGPGNRVCLGKTGPNTTIHTVPRVPTPFRNVKYLRVLNTLLWNWRYWSKMCCKVVVKEIYLEGTTMRYFTKLVKWWFRGVSDSYLETDGLRENYFGWSLSPCYPVAVRATYLNWSQLWIEPECSESIGFRAHSKTSATTWGGLFIILPSQFNQF